MTDVRFYHLGAKRLEQALPEILQKALERGLRVVVRASSPQRLESLDNALWTHDPNGFLPHSRLKDGFEAQQPIFLTLEDENPNDASMLVLTDGTDSAKIADFTLCCLIFDGNDPQAVENARARWKDLAAQGHEISYFQQDDAGRWIKK